MKVGKLRGGAGTGKTAELISIMESAKAALGGNPFAIGFASLTRAARAEAVARASAAWGVPEDVLMRQGWFRTAHGVAHRMLAVPAGAMIGDGLEAQRWVAEAVGAPVRITADEYLGLALYEGSEEAQALTVWSVARARLERPKVVLAQMARYGASVPSWDVTKRTIVAYESAKARDGRLDFSDLLCRYSGVRCTPDGHVEVTPEGDVPDEVRAWIFDEYQDSSALVDRVCRRLASAPNVLWVYVAGDEFQSVFGFSGSDSKFFVDWHADKERTQTKSHRCPRAIVNLAERCLQRMRRGYWDRGIQPADHDGCISRVAGIERAVSQVVPSDSTLILARCKYTLKDFREEFDRLRVPYSLLKEDRPIDVRVLRSLWDLEHGACVSGIDFAAVVAAMPSSGAGGSLFTRGARAAWKRGETIDRWEVVTPGTLEIAGCTEYLADRIRSGTWGDLVKGGDDWRRSAVKHGVELATEPHIRLGTIHAAKGMEADNVIVCTSTSRRVQETEENDEVQHDEERRLEYVAVTRARRHLVICDDPQARWQMRLPA